ncbi:MAG TPA: ATP-binding protein [Anaerolineales bacterium]|nr:ATP-binding protein [Anaerolineales bacterium]HNO30247.1 ATP-binding protein [Anaerolineales bacterium]
MNNIALLATRWTMFYQRMMSANFAASFFKLIRFVDEWSLIKRFTYASFIVMLVGMAGIGYWIGEKIEVGVIRESAATTALYMDSFIAPHVQELAVSGMIASDHMEALNHLFSQNNLGQRTISIKIWNYDNTIAYSNIPVLVGRSFPDTEDLVESWGGEVTGEISTLQEAENIEERHLSSEPLLEIYSPVRLNGTDRIIAIAEFYQKVDTLDAEIAAAQRRGWLIVGTTMSVIYLLLVGFVQWAGNRIVQQDLELKMQVKELMRLLAQNKELSGRVRVAAANTAALNESVLRRTGAELHDGPVQEISLALLRLDRAISQNEICIPNIPDNTCNEDLASTQDALQSALSGMRTIAAGLGLPHLDGLTLPEVFFHVVRTHEQRMGTNVILHLQNVPDHADLSTKIASYRFIQEGLKNAYQHAGGKGQSVRITCKAGQLQIEITDQGPGFVIGNLVENGNHLGLIGMRERIESLGGLFTIKSQMDQGTTLIASLPLQNVAGNKNG